MNPTEFRKLAVANAVLEKTTGMFKAEDGSTLYFLDGQAVSRSVFDAESGLAHLSGLGFDAQPSPGAAYEAQCEQQAVEPVPAWFASLAMTVVDSLPPVVMIGACRSGKSRLAGVLRHEVLKHGVRASIREHQSVHEAEQAIGVGSPAVFQPDQRDLVGYRHAVSVTLKDVHLIAFRQSSLRDAEILSESLNRRITPDELYSLPRWHALIRLAGQDSVVVVDTKVLYPE